MLSKSQLYIHIGMPKVASSTIQKGLSSNSDLLKKDGYIFPEIGFHRGAHHNFANEIRGGEMFFPEYGTISDLLAFMRTLSNEKVIISSEAFYQIKEEYVKLFRSRLQEIKDIKIILYIRRQDLRFQSLWTQLAKLGQSNNNFEEFVQATLKVQDEYTKIKFWEKAFGKGGVIIRVFEKAQLNNHVFYDFLSTCGITDVEKYAIPPYTNRGPSRLEMSILFRLFNKLGEEILLDHQARWAIFKSVREFLEINNLDPKEKLQLIDENMYNQIMGRFEKTNHQIAQSYFNRDELFLEPYVQQPITDYTYIDLAPDVLVDLQAYVLAKLFGIK